MQPADERSHDDRDDHQDYKDLYDQCGRKTESSTKGLLAAILY